MVVQRWRPVFIALGAVVAIWIVAITCYSIAKNSKPTAERTRAYVDSVDLNKLSASERQKAIKRLADMLNALSPDGPVEVMT